MFDMRFHTTEILLKASQQTLQACLTFFDYCCVIQTSDRMQSTDFWPSWFKRSGYAKYFVRNVALHQNS